MLELSHKRLRVWELGIELVTIIYEFTNRFPLSERYGLTNQLRRAAVSIPSNIAEGAARSSRMEKRRYFEIARSSLVEIDTQIEIARRLRYCPEEDIASCSGIVNRLFAYLSNLIDKST